MTDEELLYAVLDDKIRECENNNYISCTSFLDIYQQSKAMRYLAKMKTKYELFGGFEDCERRIVIFLPEYDRFPILESGHFCGESLRTMRADWVLPGNVLRCEIAAFCALCFQLS